MATTDINDHKTPITIIINPTAVFIFNAPSRAKPLDSKEILYTYQRIKNNFKYIRAYTNHFLFVSHLNQ